MRILVKTLLFLLIGELIFTAHKQLNHTEVKDVKNTTKGLKYINTNPTIFLFGNSFTKGLGISLDKRLPFLLRIKGYNLVDSSYSGDNWSDYYFKLKSVKSKMKPNDIIIIGTTWVDIDFKKDLIKTLSKADSNIVLPTSNSSVENSLKKEEVHKGFKYVLHWLYWRSAMVGFLSQNIQNTLKRHGMPLPIGTFHYLKTIGYADKKAEMDIAMSELNKISQEKSVNIILYLMPDFNLTNQIDYYKNFRNYYLNSSYLKSPRIKILDGPMYFRNEIPGKYCLSIHDGHPNSSAHLVIADQLIKEVRAIKAGK